jgi:hypothetical protein
LVNDRTHQPDAEELRASYPLWDICITWTTRAAGPDLRVWAGSRAGVRVAGFSAAEVARLIEAAEAEHGWPRS